jgi:hypothetical protein
MSSATRPAHKLFAPKNRQTAVTSQQLPEQTAACIPHAPLDPSWRKYAIHLRCLDNTLCHNSSIMLMKLKLL